MCFSNNTESKQSSPLKPGINAVQAPGSPFADPYLSCGLVPDPREPSLIALPQTLRQTRKLFWLKPHPGSTPDLDSPALPCRSSSTSPRWPSACAAGSLPKPEPALRSPHCQAQAPPWTLSSCLLARGEGTELGPYPFLSPSFQLPSPKPQWARPKYWGRGRGRELD